MRGNIITVNTVLMLPTCKARSVTWPWARHCCCKLANITGELCATSVAMTPAGSQAMSRLRNTAAARPQVKANSSTAVAVRALLRHSQRQSMRWPSSTSTQPSARLNSACAMAAMLETVSLPTPKAQGLAAAAVLAAFAAAVFAMAPATAGMAAGATCHCTAATTMPMPAPHSQ